MRRATEDRYHVASTGIFLRYLPAVNDLRLLVFPEGQSIKKPVHILYPKNVETSRHHIWVRGSYTKLPSGARGPYLIVIRDGGCCGKLQ